jgi:hypothetical protein
MLYMLIVASYVRTIVNSENTILSESSKVPVFIHTYLLISVYVVVSSYPSS